MAMPKVYRSIDEKLDRVLALLEGQQQAAPAPTVTKKQLTDIDGVGEATAEKILDLLKGE